MQISCVLPYGIGDKAIRLKEALNNRSDAFENFGYHIAGMEVFVACRVFYKRRHTILQYLLRAARPSLGEIFSILAYRQRGRNCSKRDGSA
jgi:hypothetical protein